MPGGERDDVLGRPGDLNADRGRRGCRPGATTPRRPPWMRSGDAPTSSAGRDHRSRAGAAPARPRSWDRRALHGGSGLATGVADVVDDAPSGSSSVSQLDRPWRRSRSDGPRCAAEVVHVTCSHTPRMNCVGIALTTRSAAPSRATARARGAPITRGPSRRNPGNLVGDSGGAPGKLGSAFSGVRAPEA